MSAATDLGLLAVRVGFGAAALSHGTQKLFGWFGGGGIKGTGAFFESTGFVPGERNALVSGLCEAGGGTLLALGLASGPAGAALAGNMVVASSTHAENGFFGTAGGYELPALYGLVAAAVAGGGPGRFSLDAATGQVLNRPWMRVVALVGAGAASVLMITARQTALATQQDSDQVDTGTATEAAESPEGAGD